MMAVTALYALWIGELLLKAKSQSRPRAWLGPGVPLVIYVACAALRLAHERDQSFVDEQIMEQAVEEMFSVGKPLKA